MEVGPVGQHSGSGDTGPRARPRRSRGSPPSVARDSVTSRRAGTPGRTAPRPDTAGSDTAHSGRQTRSPARCPQNPCLVLFAPVFHDRSSFRRTQRSNRFSAPADPFRALPKGAARDSDARPPGRPRRPGPGPPPPGSPGSGKRRCPARPAGHQPPQQRVGVMLQVVPVPPGGLLRQPATAERATTQGARRSPGRAPFPKSPSRAGHTPQAPASSGGSSGDKGYPAPLML